MNALPGDTPRSLPQSAAFAVLPDAVVLAFDEVQVRTMITTPQGKNLRARGRFWLAREFNVKVDEEIAPIR